MSDTHQDWVAIALLGRPRGNRGELTAIGLTSKPDRFDDLEHVYLSGYADPFLIEEIWEHKGSLIFKFAGIDSISDAEKYQGCEVRLPFVQRAQLEAGEFYHSDLIGCEVFDVTDGRSLGKVTSFQDAAGGGLLVINEAILFPFASALCKVIDVANHRIEVAVPVGLLDLNQT